MKICFMANASSIHTKRWVSYFVDRGHSVYLLTFHKNKYFPDMNVNQLAFKHVSNNIFLNFIYYILTIRFYLNQIKPDIVHAHWLAHYGVAAAFSGFKPYIVTVWGGDINRIPLENYVKRALIKWVLKNASFVTINATYLYKTLNFLGCEQSKIKFIAFGTDVNAFRPLKQRKRKKLDLNKTIEIISTRSLNPAYDVNTLIKAISVVNSYFRNFHVTIIGEGRLKKDLINSAKKLKVQNKVSFIGYIDNNSLPKYLSNADIYVSTSLSDAGLAASTAEAMACEIPVIITNFGDNYKYVEKSKSGLTFQGKNYIELAEKLLFLIKSPSLRIEMGINGRNKIIKDLNYYVEMEKMNTLYENISLVKKIVPARRARRSE